MNRSHKNRPLKLLVAISGHGFGHAAQVAPAVNALRERLPHLELFIYSIVPPKLLQSRFDGPFELIASNPDVAMAMSSPIDVEAEKTLKTYLKYHQEWEVTLEQDTTILQNIKPNLVLSDVSYSILAAAKRLGIPSIALSSINWADIFMHYCGNFPEASKIHSEITSAYKESHIFITPEPSIEMKDFERIKSVGPLVYPAQKQKLALRKAIGIQEDKIIVLLALGGIPLGSLIRHWPSHDSLLCLTSPANHIDAPGFLSVDRIPALQNMHFADLQASCDCLIAKPGYNTFVEAGIYDIPMLYVRRSDWPEEPYLINWINRYGRSLEVSREKLMKGDFIHEIQTVLSLKSKTPPMKNGAKETADILSSYL